MDAVHVVSSISQDETCGLNSVAVTQDQGFTQLQGVSQAEAQVVAGSWYVNIQARPSACYRLRIMRCHAMHAQPCSHSRKSATAEVSNMPWGCNPIVGLQHDIAQGDFAGCTKGTISDVSNTTNPVTVATTPAWQACIKPKSTSADSGTYY